MSDSKMKEVLNDYHNFTSSNSDQTLTITTIHTFITNFRPSPNETRETTADRKTESNETADS